MIYLSLLVVEEYPNEVKLHGCTIKIPKYPAKFAKCIESRKAIFREISSMVSLSE